MWQELVFVHRDSKASSPPLQGPGHLWRTCLRELLFLEPGDVPQLVSEDAQLHGGFEAHRKLVEICSGLQSPLFGETEVFGQFKAFRESQAFHPKWESLLTAVEDDVRKLRRKFLTDLGPQSYGSLARRHLPSGSQVIVVGAGRLARDLMPWLTEMKVRVVARHPEKTADWLPVSASTLGLSLLNSTIAELAGAHWIVAAPVSNEELESLWSANAPGLVLDFRGDQCFSQTPERASSYLGLRALYQELEAVKQLHERKKKEAISFAHELTKRHEQSVVHRPFGWEDAFA